MYSPDDCAHMARALQLAALGQYSSHPNPMVGCVLVNDGEVVGEGWHERAGEPHAEINALREAGNKAKGAAAYVSLEPCAHHGKTPMNIHYIPNTCRERINVGENVGI